MKLLPKLAASLVASVALFSASTSFAQTKFAVVDVQRAVMENEDGLRAQATLKKYFDKRQQELDKKQTELQKERDEIEKQQKTLSPQAIEKKLADWQRKMVELQTTFVEYNKELQTKQSELTQPIYTKITAVLRKLATQDGYDAILEKATVPYVRNDLDLTERVIQAYNGTAGTPSEAPKGGDGKKKK